MTNKNKKAKPMTYIDAQTFHDFNPETRHFIEMVFDILLEAHMLEKDGTSTSKTMLQAYSPSNELINSKNSITWGEGLHHLIFDILMKKNIHLYGYGTKTLH